MSTHAMRSFLLLLIGILLLGPSNTRSGVLPNDAEVAGRTIAEWSAEWWKWVFSVPTNQNPLLDTDGRYATNGNSGPVFFLAGVLGISRTQTRSFTVPEDTCLLVPLINTWSDNVATDPPFTIEELRDNNDGSMQFVTELHASVDGVPVTNLFSYRAISPVFSIEYRFEDNIHSFLLEAPFLGVVDPMVADGYYLMIEPLRPGPHVITFGGTISSFFLTIDITNHITVAPMRLDRQVERLIATVDAAPLPLHRRQALREPLEAARASFAAGELRAGIRELRTFQRKVQVLVAPHDPTLAKELIRSAEEIIERARKELSKRRK